MPDLESSCVGEDRRIELIVAIAIENEIRTV